jgi:hypothetical protein
MHDHQHIEMSSTAGTTLQNTKWQSCIDACMRCAEACEFCATSDLKERDVKCQNDGKLCSDQQRMRCCLLDIVCIDVYGQPICKAILQPMR